MTIEIKNKKVFYISIVSVLLLIAAVYIFWRHTKGNDYEIMADSAKKNKGIAVPVTDPKYKAARNEALKNKKTEFVVDGKYYDTVSGRTIKTSMGFRDAQNKAVANKQPTFVYNNKKYNTQTGLYVKGQ